MDKGTEIRYGVIRYSEDEYTLREAKIILVHSSPEEAHSEAGKLQEELGWENPICGSDLVEYVYFTSEKLIALGNKVVSKVVTIETTEFVTENAGSMRFVQTIETSIENRPQDPT